MTSQADHETYMDLAIAEAQKGADAGNTAVAALIVRDGAILGMAPATQQTGNNPCQHAEINAIGLACEAIESTDLSGATLYCTLEPCPMCAWAIHIAKIARVVIGARYSDLGRTDLGSYRFEDLMRMTGQNVELVTDVRKQECIGFRLAWMRRTGRIV